MKQTAKAALLGGGGVTTMIVIARDAPLLILVAAILLVPVAAVVCLVWAVVFAASGVPVDRFERVVAALVPFAVRTPTAQRPSDDPQDQDGPR